MAGVTVFIEGNPTICVGCSGEVFTFRKLKGNQEVFHLKHDSVFPNGENFVISLYFHSLECWLTVQTVERLISAPDFIRWADRQVKAQRLQSPEDLEILKSE